MRWGLHTSVDDVVSENVPGAQALHSTFPFGALELATPKPGPHLLSLMHCRQLPEWVFKAQYLPASQAHTRFCCLVQARISTWSVVQEELQLKHVRNWFQTWVYMLASQSAHTVSEVLLQKCFTYWPGGHLAQHI